MHRPGRPDPALQKFIGKLILQFCLNLPAQRSGAEFRIKTGFCNLIFNSFLSSCSKISLFLCYL